MISVQELYLDWKKTVMSTNVILLLTVRVGWTSMLTNIFFQLFHVSQRSCKEDDMEVGEDFFYMVYAMSQQQPVVKIGV